MQVTKEELAKTMAFLMLVTPETTIGKLLNFCLAVKVEQNGENKGPLELANALLEGDTKLAYWTQEAMGSDNQYSKDEWQALGTMGLSDPEKFMNDLWKELENLQS